ncbi:tRNA pseudouridine(13) synthase TruD [Candidatus Thiothrix sp. Deng01]|uniref:tRNA pseudouridine synthase D n=1 Tax=Candidatus Thiothrix phosphatis TaxID=3112415 RepID=A0ABU6CX38_9GAMM|nr:tRNA pseudouridine(13) synthase TruD [Candidatus Thiothrix sp. Deng01]MEB4591107.1 tRNA pseudouridine(13) synthase TruD [Candidatus Thiothrix sp. Deng01]
MNTTDYAATPFARAYPAPLQGAFRTLAEDFIVDEQMDIALSGSGEHLWLQVRKTGANTDWAAGQLARCAGVPAADVGYAGLKDRHAVATQWFSLQLPGRADPDFSALPPELVILQQQRHDRKLRRGALVGNRFTLTLRDCSGDFAEAEQVCQQIAQYGLPNYYGEQRFGHNFGNLLKAERWFQGEFKPKQRNQRSLYLSAARSWVFNHILAARVAQGSWCQRLPGDIFMFDGGSAWFADDASPELQQRLDALEIHPTGALWGRGELETQAVARDLEQAQADAFTVFCAGLEKQGLKQERRALRIRVGDIGFERVDGSTLKLSFELPPGAYATVLLGQLGTFHAPAPTRDA